MIISAHLHRFPKMYFKSEHIRIHLLKRKFTANSRFTFEECFLVTKVFISCATLMLYSEIVFAIRFLILEQSLLHFRNSHTKNVFTLQVYSKLPFWTAILHKRQKVRKSLRKYRYHLSLRNCF